MSARCLKTVTIPAKESQCVLAEGHADGCIGEGDGKRHHVLKAEPGIIGAAGLLPGQGAKPEGARFMVRLGGDKTVPIITPEEVLNETNKSMTRDRLLATALVAQDRVTQVAPRGLPDATARLRGELAELSKKIIGRLWFGWIAEYADEGKIVVTAVDEDGARKLACEILKDTPDRVAVAMITEGDVETMQDLMEEGFAAKLKLHRAEQLLQTGYGIMPVGTTERADWIKAAGEFIHPKPAAPPCPVHVGNGAKGSCAACDAASS